MENENVVYKQLAELKLENRLLSERLAMMTRAVTSRDTERAALCQQLNKLGFLLVNGTIEKQEKQQ